MARLTAVCIVLLSALLSTQVVAGQQAGDRPQFPTPDLGPFERFEVLDVSSLPPSIIRVRELGMVPVQNSTPPVFIFITDGTVVYADDFVLNPDTNNVDAIGNVRMLMWAESRLVSQVEADQLTITEPTDPIGQ